MNNFMIFNIILSLHLIKYILQGEFIIGLLIDMNIFVKKNRSNWLVWKKQDLFYIDLSLLKKIH